MRHKPKEWGVLDRFDILDFQWVGRLEPNPTGQLASTSYLRVFAQSRDRDVCAKLLPAWSTNAMQHFSGFHSSMDFRAGIPREYLGFYPGVISQSELDESINIISKEGGNIHRTVLGPPQETKPIEARENYDTQDPVNLSSFGNTVTAPLGDVALARSGDKGANVNFGLYVHTDEEWDWLRSFMTRAKLQELMASTWEN